MKAIRFALVAAAMGILAQSAVADDCHTPCGLKKTCKVENVVKKEKKKCFSCECKDVCIPGLTLPGQCEPRCGRVRTVRVLVKRDVDVEKCGCKWSVQLVCDDACAKAAKPCKTKCDPCCPDPCHGAKPAQAAPVQGKVIYEGPVRVVPGTITTAPLPVLKPVTERIR